MKYKTKILLILAVFSFFLAFPSAYPALGEGFKYTPMEKIPGFNTSGDFAEYMSSIYKFGIAAIGIAALLMISVGAFTYLTSAGNNAQMGKAKEIITNAIIGIIMALTAYLLLYTINPDLVKIKSISNGGGSGNNNNNSTEECVNKCEKDKCKGMEDEELGECSDKCKSGCKNSGGDGDKKGSGKCEPVTSGVCSVDELKKNSCWSSSSADLSKVSSLCNKESSGADGRCGLNDPNKSSCADKCTDGTPFSCGAFQVNLTCQCKDAFTGPQKKSGCANKLCTGPSSSYKSCAQEKCSGDGNLTTACNIYKQQGYNAWSTNKGKNGCGF